MCGIVGVAGDINGTQEGIFKRLLELDTIRGPHSTGILGVDARGFTSVVKKVGTPWDLYEYKQFDEIFRKRLTVLLGHNRWATKGKIIAQNAHPFEHDHIIGVHNGTLRNQSLLINHQKFEVDSDNIFHSISEVGVDDTVKNLSGAFALVWYDSAQETINFVRNTERPINICMSENRKTIYWASEAWMLEVTLKLANVKHHPIFEPASGELFSYPIQMKYNPEVLENPTVRPLELHKYVVTSKTTSTSGTTTVSGGKTVTAAGNVFTSTQKTEGTPAKKTGNVTATDLIMQDRVEFFVSSEAKTPDGQRYVQCYPTQDDCNVELRVYCDQDKNMWEWLMDGRCYFEGKVRRFSSVEGSPGLSYCVLDPRTIAETTTAIGDDIPDDDDQETAIIYGGKVVNEEEFDMAVCGGCANCKQIAFIEESDEIVWLDKFNFICPECKDLPVVQEFIKTSLTPDTVKH
ncbi:Glutamine--fructose-6-phosphate aminotransferase [isomerizing] [compost metagenome]